MGQLDQTFGALADATRRGVIDLLRREPRRASDLADELGASRPAMSRHLRVLRECGLVDTSRDDDDDAADDARVRMYRLRPERFAELRDWLDEVEAFWTDQLAAFAAHVTRTRSKR